MSRLERWFGPSDTWLAEIIWPIIGLPVMTVVFALVVWYVMAGTTPAP